jgi:hypothetical protein
MEEAPENGKESTHSAQANGMNKLKNFIYFLSFYYNDIMLHKYIITNNVRIVC